VHCSALHGSSKQQQKVAALLGHELVAFWVDAGYSRQTYGLAGVIFPPTMVSPLSKVCVGFVGVG
jgi:hypothetical protein